MLLITAATRISADFIPNMQGSHYAYAALLWAVVLALWLAVFGPLITIYPNKGTTE